MDNKDSKSNSEKLITTIRKISFLMEHKNILPDLQSLADGLKPENAFAPDYLYMLGAYHALSLLINDLKDKSAEK
jgi:hypothetical protein